MSLWVSVLVVNILIGVRYRFFAIQTDIDNHKWWWWTLGKFPSCAAHFAVLWHNTMYWPRFYTIMNFIGLHYTDSWSALTSSLLHLSFHLVEPSHVLNEKVFSDMERKLIKNNADDTIKASMSEQEKEIEKKVNIQFGCVVENHNSFSFFVVGGVFSWSAAKTKKKRWTCETKALWKPLKWIMDGVQLRMLRWICQ